MSDRYETVHAIEIGVVVIYAFMWLFCAALWVFMRWNMTEISVAIVLSIDAVAIALAIYVTITRLLIGIPPWTLAGDDTDA